MGKTTKTKGIFMQCRNDKIINTVKGKIVNNLEDNYVYNVNKKRNYLRIVSKYWVLMSMNTSEQIMN